MHESLSMMSSENRFTLFGITLSRRDYFPTP